MRGAIDVMPHRTTDTPQQTYDEAEAGRFSPSDGVVDAAATVRGEPPRQETRASRRSEPQVLGECGPEGDAVSAHEQRRFRAFANAEVKHRNLAGVDDLETPRKGADREVGILGGGKDGPRSEQLVEGANPLDERTTHRHVGADAPGNARARKAMLID